MGKLEQLDAFQRRHPTIAFLFAVQKKFGDDRGGYLAALITYYAFVSIFPLILAAFTVAAYVLSGDKSAVASLERHIGHYPIVGPALNQLQGQKLQGSPLPLVAGVLGLLWGATGLAQAVQFSMNQAWNIPNKDRRGFLPRLTRSFAWYAVFGVGIVASTFVASLGSVLNWAGGPALSALLALILNVGLFWTSFWLLSGPNIGLRAMVPGAVAAGTVWTFLTGIGIGLTHMLAHSNELYGTFAPVLGLLAFLYLAARITIYSVEANAVLSRRLWPRSLNDKNLSAADLRQLTEIAGREERVKGENIEVGF